MNESALKPLNNRKAVCGSIAILCFCVALCLYLYAAHIILEDVQAWAMILGATQGNEDGGVTDPVFAASRAQKHFEEPNLVSGRSPKRCNCRGIAFTT
jgi:hypothetical protein